MKTLQWKPSNEFKQRFTIFSKWILILRFAYTLYSVLMVLVFLHKYNFKWAIDEANVI